MLVPLLAVWLAGADVLGAQDPWPGGGRDRGRGVVSHELTSFRPETWPAADTLQVHEAPSPSSRVLARFVFLVPEPFAWSYSLETVEEGVESRAVEFDYELLGLPIDSFPPDSSWVRVLYARGPDREPRYGWVPAADGAARVWPWDEILPERHLFFLGPADGIRFHDGPGGKAIHIDLAPGPLASPPTFDYRLEPMAVDGAWMQVRVVTPDDACGATAVATREYVTWIEYLDDRGRPRVWYYTRGC